MTWGSGTRLALQVQKEVRINDLSQTFPNIDDTIMDDLNMD